MKIKTYLINLDDSTKRLKQATQYLKSAQLAFKRISAFDGRNINLSVVDEYRPEAAKLYMGRELNGGEIGCYFSHINCVKQFLNSNADYALILEDDMTCPKDLSKKITDILTYLEEGQIDWFLINIGANKNKISTPLEQFSEYTIYRNHYFSMTTTGLIWSKEGAHNFLSQYKKNKIFCPVDNYFRYWLTNNNKGLSIYPPLTPASGVESNIDLSKNKRAKQNRHFFYHIIKQKRLFSDKLKALKHKYV